MRIADENKLYFSEFEENAKTKVESKLEVLKYINLKNKYDLISKYYIEYYAKNKKTINTKTLAKLMNTSTNTARKYMTKYIKEALKEQD